MLHENGVEARLRSLHTGITSLGACPVIHGRGPEMGVGHDGLSEIRGFVESKLEKTATGTRLMEDETLS